ncbi:Dicer-like protein 2 [Pseudocyphellaria aurata]|nr:Dicer-like protein 2 [Pseudocyphellaria aurata]
MQNFYHRSIKGVLSENPAILGLTASPVINNGYRGLENLEQNLNAISSTPKLHREMMLQFVHQPNLLRLLYPPNTFETHVPEALIYLRAVYAGLDIEKDPYVIKLKEASSSTKTSSSLNDVLLNRKTYCQTQIKGFLCKAEQVQLELGSWATGFFIRACLENFGKAIAEETSSNFDALDAAEKSYIRSAFAGFQIPACNGQALNDDSQISSKVKILVDFLETKMSANFSGLVFVQTRAAVAVLAHLISHHPRTRNAFCVGTFVGASSNLTRRSTIGELVNTKNQTRTLEELHLGQRNLVITTSALEEGIDIAACNNVVCFEKPPNLKSFIQRRGRARNSESTYAIMFEEGSGSDTLSSWHDLEYEMRRAYMDDMRRLKEIRDLEGQEEGGREFRIESTGALLTLDGAVPHLYHFCATLTQTQYTDARPIFTFSKSTLVGDIDSVTARVLLPSSVHKDVQEACSSSSWRTEKSAKKDAAFEAYIALYRVGLVNEHLLPIKFDPEADEARSVIEKRPNVAEVPPQLDVWSSLVAYKWQGQPEVYESLVSITFEGVALSEMLMILPLALPNLIEFDLHWNATKSFRVVITSVRSAPYNQECVSLYAECTAVLLRSIYKARMESDDTDFACLFIPQNIKEIRLWLEKAGESSPARNLLDTNISQSQVGLIYDLQNNRTRHIFHGVEPMPHDAQQDLVNGACVGNGPCLKVTKLPKRTDFPHKVSPKHDGTDKDNEIKYLYLSPSRCEVDNLPFEFSRFAMLVPSIMHQIELYVAADSCRNSLLSSIQFDDLNLLITATTTPVAAEQSNYQRLEFLGDSILKLFTSLTVMAEHLNWPEGYLSGKKDHTVSNGRLASAAIKLGLAPYIRTISFTGHRWRPLHISDLMNNQIKKFREMSTKTLADIVEALIGASYIDGGPGKVLNCLGVFLPEISWGPLSQQTMKIYETYDANLQYPPNFAQLERLVNHTFTAKILLVEALTHPSHHGPTISGSYQRLEFLGDSILDSIIVTTAYSHQPPIPTLALHLIRTALVNASFLAFICLTHSVPTTRSDPVSDHYGNFSTVEITNSLQIWRFMRHAAPEIRQAQQSSVARYNSLREEIKNALRLGQHYPWALLCRLEAPKFFSDLIESLIGAIYIDTHGSIVACESFLEHIGVMRFLRRVINEDVALLHPKEEVGHLADIEKVKYVVKTEAMEEEEKRGRLICEVWVGERMVVKVEDGFSKTEVETRAAEEAVRVLKAENREMAGKMKNVTQMQVEATTGEEMEPGKKYVGIKRQRKT